MVPYNSFFKTGEENGKDSILSLIDNKSYDISASNAWVSFLTQLYTNSVTIEHPGETSLLRFVLYLPLWDEKAWKLGKKLITEAAKVKGCQLAVDVIGVSADFAYKLGVPEDATNAREVLSKVEVKQIEDIIAFRSSGLNLLERFVIFQDFNENGLALNLSTQAFTHILCEYAILVSENYNSIYPMAISPGHVTGIGMTVLYLDNEYFVNYLLRKAFLRVLENENITQEKVDVNQLQEIVQKALRGQIDIYSIFYKDHVVPCIEKKMSDQEIVSKISPELNAFFQQLLEKFQAIVSAEGLSLPDKQAAFALLLGLDDALLEGYLYDKDVLDIDDGFCSPIDIFIDVNNSLVGTEAYQSHGPIIYPLDSDGHAYSPIKQIKALKAEMRQVSNGIRRWEKELDGISLQQEIKEQSTKRLVDGKFQYGDHKYQLVDEIVQEPLSVTYEPKITPKDAVDLRDFLTPVRNQGSLGSCCVFATTSMYEYLLKKADNVNHDLSERYVFYYTNILKGKPEGGASYKTVLDAIAENGVCDESLCPYDLDKMQEEPSIQARNAAQAHRVTEAMNVNVCHEHITSAVSEGYPVGISLKLFESFGETYKGFVSYPTEDELASGETGYHAMVVVGYSERDKVYIVRNSWGESFGDNGYCYIPFSYVDNPDLNAFSCILSKTTDDLTPVAVKEGVQVDFNMADNSIRSILLKIKIGEEKNKLASMEKDYANLQMEFQRLLLTLEDQSIRERISKDSIMQLKNTLDIKQKALNDFTAQIPEDVNVFRKSIIKSTVIVGVIVVLLALICWGTHMWMRMPAKQLIDEEKKESVITNKVLEYMYPVSEADSHQEKGSFSKKLKKVDYSKEKTIDGIKDKMAKVMKSDKTASAKFEKERDFVFPGYTGSENIARKVRMGFLVATLAGVLLVVFMISRIAIRVKEYRRMLDDTRDRMNAEIFGIQVEIASRPVRLHLAGMIIDRLTELKQKLTNKYHLSVSYVGNLKVWYGEEQAKYDMMRALPKQKPPFISVIDDSVLDSYFADNKDAILKNLKFGDFLNDFDVLDDSKIEEHKKNLIKMVYDRLHKVADEFLMIDYLIGSGQYKYLPTDKTFIDKKLTDFYTKSNIFLRFNQLNPTGSVNKCVYLLANVPESRRDKWEQTYSANFMTQPVELQMADASQVVLLRTLELDARDIVALQ